MAAGAACVRVCAGSFEKDTDYLRLTLEGVREPSSVSASSSYAFAALQRAGTLVQVGTPAEVDACALPARVCWCYERARGAWHVRFGAANATSSILGVDGVLAGFKASVTDLLLTWGS